MAQHIELGRKGEQLAAQYLIKKGFQLLHKNWHYRNQELDLVMRHMNELVVVEVKSRHAAVNEAMDEAISFKKIRFLVNATQAYLEKYQLELDVRFDVVSLVFHSNTNYTIKHIPDAFNAPVD